MARQYDFGNNQILRPEFLNILQKILQSYLDIFFLEASGNQVLAPATVDDPISVNIDRRMRRVATTLTATVSGAAGTRDVYFALRSGGVSLEVVEDGAEPVGALAHRHVGEAQWDGTTVTSVTTYPVRTGADMLGGRSSAYEPHPFGIPVTNEDGRLHPGWFPETEAKTEMVGTIRRVWVAPGQTLDIGEDWVAMEGQTLGPTEHSFPGGGSVTIPDMRNKTTRGASLALAAGTAGTSTTPPGLGGASGSNAPRNLTHTHPVAAHGHTVGSHGHSAIPSHTHAFPNHSHTEETLKPLSYLAGATVTTFQVGSPVGAGAAPGTDGPLGSVGGASTLTLVDNSDAVSGGNSGGPDEDLSTVDVRPAHVGLVHLLKVH